nr:hypothetical protein [Tanacetum cinerariifolium]
MPSSLPTWICRSLSPTVLGRDHHRHWLLSAGEHGNSQMLPVNILKLSMTLIMQQMAMELHFFVQLF